MSCPKNYISILFIDFQPHSFTKLSSQLFLPFKKTKRILKYFDAIKRNKILYVRMQMLPVYIRNIVVEIEKQMMCNVYYFLNPETDVLLHNVSLERLTDCLNSCSCKRQLQKWLRIIFNVKKWRKDDPVYGKYVILFAFLLNAAVSSEILKKQLRL